MNERDDKGNRHRYWELYWNDEYLMFKGNFNNGVRVGYWERYWSNGNLWSKGNYNNGEPDGYWKWYSYNNNGSIIEKEFYL
jgi:antitoxin component YwqK of YwqJK toxin-antitoxin module